MKSQFMNLQKGHAILLGIILAIIIIAGYSYIFLHSFFAGFYEFYNIFSKYPIQGAIIFIIGLIMGYLLGKSY